MENYKYAVTEIMNSVDNLIGVYATNRERLNLQHSERLQRDPEFSKERLDTSKQSDLEEEKIKIYDTLDEKITQTLKQINIEELTDDKDYTALKKPLNDLNGIINNHRNDDEGFTVPYKNQVVLRDAILIEATKESVERLNELVYSNR